MKQTLLDYLRALKNFIYRNRKWIIGLVVVGVVALIALLVICSLVVEANKKYVLPTSSHRHVRTGIVLGAGITKQGKPFKELQARLDVAAEALKKGRVDRLILSGDNRFTYYDEPTAMKNYLVKTKHIDKSKLQPDYAGRSTYESCERAAKVFGLKETIIYSAGSHLPRAIYLCRHFGIEAYGISSGVEANNSARRELLARVKAVLNVTIGGQNSILGPKISL